MPASAHSLTPPTEQITRAIRRAIRAYAPRAADRDPPFYEAAVVMLMRVNAGPIELLFIERARREDDPWSGQIALPGGRRDAGDASLEATVIRETREEMGIDLDASAEIVGSLDELRPRTPVLPPVIVRPFVAFLTGDVKIEASDEVAAHFWAPLDAILDPAATRETEILVRGVRRTGPAILYEGRVIWGMTERILRQFAGVVGEARGDG